MRVVARRAREPGGHDPVSEATFNARLVSGQHMGGRPLVVELPGFALCDPEPDRVPRDSEIRVQSMGVTPVTAIV